MNNVKDVVVTSAYIPNKYRLTPIAHAIEVDVKKTTEAEEPNKKSPKPTKK